MAYKSVAIVAGFSVAAAVVQQALRCRSAAARAHALVVPRGEKLTPEDDANEISVVSYNVLCQRFATPQRLPHVVPRFHLDYEYRRPLLERELREFAADIVCLQEVTTERWEELRSFMASLGYDSMIQRKPHEVVLAVFWRASRLALRWSEERSRALLLELEILDGSCNTPPRCGQPAGGASPPPPPKTPELAARARQRSAPHERSFGSNGRVASEDREAMTAPGPSEQATCQERPASSPRLLHVVNVHLEAAPQRPHDRVNQIRHALQRLESHLAAQKVAPEAAKLVVCGDFNSQVDEAPCRLLREGRLVAGTTDACRPDVPVTEHQVEHPFQLREVYDEAGAAPPFTRKVGQRGTRMDFLWCSATLGVVRVLRPLPTALRELVHLRGLPNRALPSDHLPIGAVLCVGDCAQAGSPL